MSHISHAIRFVALLVALSAPLAGADAIDFGRDIRPILADKCFACHGPDTENNLSPLRFDSEAKAMADLGGGRHAIVRGHPEQSELVKRITAQDTDIRMPPVYAGRDLTAAEIEKLTAWIEQGAPWQQHWAFNRPERPAAPKIHDAGWVRNPIDAFVLERLEEEGLRHAGEAARTTLIRRVSLDLTGLPATPAEVDAFLQDESADAYEKVVDRLLASPRYAERMAFRWLDAARYADTNGYQVDGDREMWRWRDWVIDAFHRNMPYDQFVIEQLAGDLLPHPTLDQRIATGFNRNHRGNAEDGLVPAEYAVEYVVDRVDTVSTVFLGLTMGCARCHNHKFDPLTQKEYYQLYAYFNSIPEDGRFSNFGNAAPWIFAPTREQQEELRGLEAEIAASKSKLDRLLAKAEGDRRRWESSLADAEDCCLPADDLIVHQPFDEGAGLWVSEEQASAKAPAKTDEPGDGVEAAGPDFRDGSARYAPSPLGQGAVFDGNVTVDAGDVAAFDYRDRLHDFKDRFSIAAWFYADSEDAGAILSRMRDDEDGDGELPQSRGYGLFFMSGRLHFNLVGVWADDSFRVSTKETIGARQWHHVVATFDSLQPHEKVRIYVDGREQELDLRNGRLFRQFSVSDAHLRIGAGGGAKWRFKGLIDDVRIYDRLLPEEQIAVLACPDTVSAIAAIPVENRTEAQALKLRYAFLENGGATAAAREWEKLRALERKRFRLKGSFTTTMVMRELPEPRPAFVLKRGAYDAPGEPVTRGVPAVLPPLPKGAPNNRLGLAQWIVSEQNPLTARVAVNRFWQMLFGVGLVKTAEDFGLQGEPPSHRELLDWLAVEFQQSGWDVKKLMKTMVMSATYRQSSKASAEELERDPDNRLLARGPRFRLSADMIRDQALFVSGLLTERQGGPSVKPYQPEGLLTDLVFSNMTEYALAKGENLWRRSLYTYWKRTVMPPAMQVFDASSREACKVRDTRTNTPLQALNLMNDVTYVEAARMLAQRMLLEGGAGPEERLTYGFRLAVGRKPDARETSVLANGLRAQLEHFREDAAAAEKLLAVGQRRNDARLPKDELAAYAVVGSLILNLDEVITKQ